MTFREWGEKYLYMRGMSPGQAAAVMGAAWADPDCPMGDRMGERIEFYPSTVLPFLSAHIGRHAVLWIDAHIPTAWYRPIFAGTTARDG